MLPCASSACCGQSTACLAACGAVGRSSQDRSEEKRDLLVVEVEEEIVALASVGMSAQEGMIAVTGPERPYLDGHHDIGAELIHTPSDVFHVKQLWKALHQVIEHLQQITAFHTASLMILLVHETQRVGSMQ